MREFTWDVNAGAEVETELRVGVNKFGDGYEQVFKSGINNARDTWPLTRTAQKPVIDQIHKFLKDHGGVDPFYMTLDGVKQSYRTVGGIKKKHIGYDVWEISFTVQQVFIP